MYKIEKKLQQDLFKAVKEYGYRSEVSFIEDALRHRILELKRGRFLVGARSIKNKIGKLGLDEEKILHDFDKFYHKK